MKLFQNKLNTLAVLLLFSSSSTAVADAGDADANARLAFSDKLTMYSNRIASSACSFTSSDAPFASRGFLATAAFETNRIVRALERGDPALGISSPEQNNDILDLLADTKNDWTDIDVMAQKILNGATSEAELADLEGQIQSFTQMSQRLVSAISNQYTDTNSLHLSEAIRLQVAGRQRMLSQKISHQACTIQRTNAQSAREDMTKTIELFELSAQALRNGMPEVGLIATTDPSLVAALDRVDQIWSELKWPLLGLENGATWDITTLNRMYLRLNELTHEMDKAVVAYTKAAKVALG